MSSSLTDSAASEETAGLDWLRCTASLGPVSNQLSRTQEREEEIEKENEKKRLTDSVPEIPVNRKKQNNDPGHCQYQSERERETVIGLASSMADCDILGPSLGPEFLPSGPVKPHRILSQL